jgi:Xaa-Pro aminopeptidase
MLRLEGMLSRRVFALVPREGHPIAITHNIEQGPWRLWPDEWRRERYSTWRALEALLAKHVGGRRVAMEWSPGDAVPYLDRVPAGVLEMVRAAGAEVVSSGELVTAFYAGWHASHLGAHRRAAEAIAAIAKDAIAYAGAQAAAGTPVMEHVLQQRIVDAFGRAGLETTHPPIIGTGPNTAEPHYSPSADAPSAIGRGALLLVDLWAREPGNIFADQTWMGSLGAPPARAVTLWNAVRDARDAAISLLRARIADGAPVRGAEVDDASRAVITSRGFGEYFTHRTGHSIDPRELHGSGPNIDNFETREERRLVPGVGFSIEPGIYISGEIGVRTEVNAYIGPSELIVTPTDYQRELLVV